MKTLLSVVLVLLLTGCATSIDSQRTKLNSSDSCCVSVKELPYQPIDLSQTTKLKFNDASASYLFEGNKSYFHALKLPNTVSKLYVKSYFNGALIGQYFHPTYIALDEQFNELKTFSPKMKFTKPKGLTQSAHMASIVSLPKGTKNLVIYTLFNKNPKISVRVPSHINTQIVNGIPIVTQTAGASAELVAAPTGILKLQAFNQ